MKDRSRLFFFLRTGLFSLAILMSDFRAFALVDNAQLISVSVQSNAQVMPRTIFTQTWTIKNTGTTTWTPGSSGYTLNLQGKDNNLGTIPLFTNSSSKWFTPSAIINGGKSVAPGSQATFSITFIAPEASGPVTNIFQLNGTTNFGPMMVLQINVISAGSTNQYDRARVIAYANNYAHFVCSDGYFWTNGSGFANFGALAAVPTAYLGDDCAHFVSCCIGSEPNLHGGGMIIPSRVPPSYGEPGAGRLVNTVLIGAGFAKEVFSLSEMEPGDVVGWNWEGDTNIANLDHVTLYLGNGLLASHAVSALDVSANTYFQSSEPNYVRHLVHIFDAPTLNLAKSGKNAVFSWGTNWTGYALYSATSLSATANWNKVTNKAVVVGAAMKVTNNMASGSMFYRLAHP